MASTRRLTAILAADVAEYARLMGADEEGTHERLKAHLGELVNPRINEHRGRIVKNTGDGFLAEFASVVDAVRCAVEIQRGTVDREPDVPEERRIRFRIGINLGDVIPLVGAFYNLIGTVHLLQSHTDEATVWLEKARNASPGLPIPRSRLAAACALRGETERAAAELAEVRRLAGEGSYSSIAHLKAAPYFRVPKVRALFDATYFAGLHKAGVPEE